MSIFSSDSKSSEDWLRLPDVAPMELDVAKPKQLPSRPKPREKDSDYIVVDGKKYRKVD